MKMGFYGFIKFTRITLILLFGLCLVHVYGEPWDDKQALYDFLQNIQHGRSLNWDPNTPLCTAWTGVRCNDGQTRVLELRLPGIGIRGWIPPNTLSRVTSLEILSLRNNVISGVVPSDFSNLKNLTSLYLQNNRFYGPLEFNFSDWQNIDVVDLSHNYFNGSVPNSISNLTHLSSLDLSNNLFSGHIPDGLGSISSLRYLNLSNNNLNGSIPDSLLRFPSSAFSGNNVTSREVSIPPIPSSFPPKSSHPHKSKKISETALLGTVIGGAILVFIMIVLCMIMFWSKKQGSQQSNRDEEEPQMKKKKGPAESREERDARVTFFEGSNMAFDLEDLLRASAEVLGKGLFGTTYKATLEDCNTVVVKRLKEVGVGKREFEQQMELVGKIKHDNVAPLRAYYYSKDEKLIVYDYFKQGSLSTILHGKRENRSPLDWETRIKIAVGAARGLAHIHSQSGGKLVHGNVKSSNIFVNSQSYGCVSDLGLVPIVTPMVPPIQRIVGYRAPEVTDPRKATQSSDVYSFGVLLLELLTGKTPLGEGTPLVKWVNSVVREEWTAEVFDIELLKYPNIEEEMVTMLQVGLACTEHVPGKRPKMSELVRMVEEIRRDTRPSSEVSTPTPTGLSHTAEVGSSSNYATPQ